MIIVLVVAIVVTVLVEDYTGTIFQGALGAYAAGAAAVAGAVSGSVVSQGVAIAIGEQDEFSWRSVGMAALSAGMLPVAGKITSDVFAKAALANAMAQGVGRVLGIQKHFQWRQVVAAGASSYVSNAVGGALGSNDDFQALFGSFGKNVVSNFASGTTRAFAMGGKIDFRQIAVDSFGNALGSAIGDSIAGSAKPRAVYDGAPALAKLDAAVQADLAKFNSDLRAKTKELILGAKDVELVDTYYEELKKEFALPADIDEQITKRSLNEPLVSDLRVKPLAAPGLPKVRLDAITIAETFNGDWSCPVPAKPGSREWFASASTAEKTAYAMTQPGPKAVAWDGVVRENSAVGYLRASGALDPRANTIEGRVGPTIRPVLLGVMTGGASLYAEGGFNIGKGSAQIYKGEIFAGSGNIFLGALDIAGGASISPVRNVPAANTGGKTVTLYRVDDAGFAPRIAADGTVPVVTTGSGTERALFVNIGQPLRAQEFALVNRGGNATVTAVEVDVSLLEKLRTTAVYDKSAAVKLNPTAPLKVDINKAPDQFGLRTPEQIQWLRDAIKPNTTRIVDPKKLR